MKKIYLLTFLFSSAVFANAQLIINEVLYDPSNTALEGDANRDGTYSQDDDSFVEIYNSSTSPFNISGYEIWDDTSSAGTVQYTFPANTNVPPQEVVVVFGGGVPVGPFGTALVLNAANGFNFNNSGEVIGIKDASGAWVLFFDSDALSNNPNESYTRFPDVTGPFIQHEDSTTRKFSPGTRADGTSFNLVSNLTENDNSTFGLAIFPNPANDVVTIKSNVKVEQFQIFSLTGQLMTVESTQSNSINIEGLTPGIYFIRATAESKVTTIRFVKK